VTRILLAVNDGRLADQLYGLAGESEELEVAGSVRDPQELRGGINRTDVDAVIVHDRRGTVSLLELTRELSITQPDLGLVLIVGGESPGEEGPDVMRAGMQAGARDVLTQPISLDALEMSVMAAAAWTQALRRRAARDAGGEMHGVGRVLTVVGAKGGVGTTTIAVHLALAARRLGTASVCLVEYDLQAGDIRSFLDLPYRRSVVDLAAVSEELTTRNLQESLYTHESGMRVLLAPLEGEQADQVSAAAARNILTAIRTREDLTIVDAGATLNEASAIAAEMSDTVLIVSTPDVVSLRGVSRMTGLWDRLKVEPPEVAVLLNRVSKRMEIQPDLARRVVSVPLLDTVIPADFHSLEAAVNTGIPTAGDAAESLMGPMGSLLGEVSAINHEQPKTASERRGRLAARLAGESGQATIVFLGVLPWVLLAALVIWQITLVGLTFALTGHAARAGARALAVGSPIVSAAESALPGSFKSGTSVHAGTPINATDTVTVTTKIPFLIPGLGVIPIHSTASTVIEDQLLQSEQNPLALIPGGNGIAFGASGVPQLKPLQIVPGNTAVLLPNGQVEAPANAPATVKKMIQAANALVGYVYCFGGGHDDQFAPSQGTTQGADGDGTCTTGQVGYDCSGATSFVLAAVNLLRTPETSSFFGTFGDPGPGKWVTIWSSISEKHVHIVIAGLNFDTVGGPGPEWHVPLPQGTGDFDGTFVETHPAGL
jgi:pilus assembly protein CpaE